jgi:hypothetical protein
VNILRSRARAALSRYTSATPRRVCRNSSSTEVAYSVSLSVIGSTHGLFECECIVHTEMCMHMSGWLGYENDTSAEKKDYRTHVAVKDGDLVLQLVYLRQHLVSLGLLVVELALQNGTSILVLEYERLILGTDLVQLVPECSRVHICVLRLVRVDDDKSNSAILLMLLMSFTSPVLLKLFAGLGQFVDLDSKVKSNMNMR